MDTTNSWELAPHTKSTDTYTPEEGEDRRADANSCMVAEMIVYKDKECKEEDMNEDILKMNEYLLYTQNMAI